MDQQRIDQLFRENLDQIEVTPSPQAWSRVERQIQPKKTYSFYWIAASISLLLISWLVWPESNHTSQTPIAGEVNYPPSWHMPSLEIPPVDEQNPSTAVLEPKTRKEKPRSTQVLAQSIPENTEMDVQESTVVSLEAKEMVANLEIEEPEVLPQTVEKAKQPEIGAIKITYIASTRNRTHPVAHQSDTTGVLKKIIAFTEKIDPGEMLADIKTAKDNLLNGGLKSKQNKNSL
jgi:hypothetical protein